MSQSLEQVHVHLNEPYGNQQITVDVLRCCVGKIAKLSLHLHLQPKDKRSLCEHEDLDILKVKKKRIFFKLEVAADFKMQLGTYV